MKKQQILVCNTEIVTALILHREMIENVFIWCWDTAGLIPLQQTFVTKPCLIKWQPKTEASNSWSLRWSFSYIFIENISTQNLYLRKSEMPFMTLTVIYIIISKNICYLLWNRGFCRSLNNTYPIFLTPCFRCTNHLCDSCDLTDVNPHFIPSLLRKIQNVDLLWRHRY